MSWLTWTTLTAALQNYVEDQPAGQPASAPFTAALPTVVSDAELRIYRELDFLATRGENNSIAFTSGNRVLDLSTLAPLTIGGQPSAYVYPVVVQRIGAQVGSNWVYFTPVSLDYLETVWPNETQTGIPAGPLTGIAYSAQINATTVVVAPTPAQSYPARVIGTWRPAPLSAEQQTSWLGDNVPDLLFAACMVEATGFIQNFGSQSDDPKMAQSWESQYQMHKTSALEEEQRRKGQGPGWQPFSPTPATGSPRT